jgi:hypothetical protein
MTHSNPQKRFNLYWLDGTVESIVGTDIATAFKNAGLGGGAINALDFWDEVVNPENEYVENMRLCSKYITTE